MKNFYTFIDQFDSGANNYWNEIFQGLINADRFSNLAFYVFITKLT